MRKKGINSPNPEKAFLTDLSKVIQKWRKEGKHHEVNLIANVNECINTNEDLQDFYLKNDLLGTVGLLNPTQTNDATYLYGTKLIDYIFITPALSAMAVKVSHHQFDQLCVSDHKGVYLQFLAGDLFDSKLMNRSHESYQRLRLGRRDIVERDIAKLEKLYVEHNF